MQINLNIICPEGWTHYQCIREVIIYFDCFLTKMRFDVTISKNFFYTNKLNIVFFAFHIPVDEPIPENTVIYNTEDLSGTTAWIFESESGKNYTNVLARFPVIDYTEINFPAIKNEKKIYLPLLHCEKLTINFERNEQNMYLFYGSLTEYRGKILGELSKHVPIKIFTPADGGEYGFFRDKLIMESRGIINLHKNEDVRYFESLRCFYPLINRIPVISEEIENYDNDLYRNSVIFLDQRGFVEQFMDLISDQKRFETCAAEKLDHFQQLDGFETFRACMEEVL